MGHDSNNEMERLSENDANHRPSPIDEKTSTNSLEKTSQPDKEFATATTIDESITEDILSEDDYTPEQYKKLLRKIDWYLLPLMWFAYGTQQIDKTALSTQAVFGLREDTHLVGQQYQWLSTIFYLMYMIGEFPSNIMLQRWRLGTSISGYMLAWGIVVICTAAAQNWTDLMALRGLQGFFECTISPGFIMIIASWYRKEEHASRALFWQSANAGFGIFAHLVMAGIGMHEEKYGGLAAWRSISLFLGACTLVLAALCFLLLGSPTEVWWLTKEEKRMAAARILHNQAGRDTTGHAWKWQQFWESFRDPQLYFLVLNTFLSGLPNGGLTSFGNIMYKSFGFSAIEVQLIDIPRAVVSMLIFLAVGIYTRRVPDRRLDCMAASTLPAFGGLLALSLLDNTAENKWRKWAAYLCTCPFILAGFMGWSILSSNIAGRTKKTVCLSAVFISYCVGNMVGGQVFQTKDAPRYVPGTIASCICLAAGFLLILSWRFYYMWVNKRRNAFAAEQGWSPEEEEQRGMRLGEQDVTDLMNPHFRYQL